MTTDLDRLHAVASGRHEGDRQAGYTTLQCHAVASLVEMGEPEIAIAVPVMRWTSHVVPILGDVLIERGVGGLEQTGVFSFVVAGTSITFVARYQLERALLGSRAVVVEIDR